MGRDKGIAYITIAVCAASIAANIFFYAAKSDLIRKKQSLETRIERLAVYNKRLSEQRRGLRGHKKDLEYRIEDMKKDLGRLGFELGAEKTKNLQTASDIAGKVEEIGRLNEEIETYKRYDSDLEERFTALTAAYDALAAGFDSLAGQKDVSEDKLNRIVSDMANEESATSLGTVVVNR